MKCPDCRAKLNDFETFWDCPECGYFKVKAKYIKLEEQNENFL
jgi:rubredoxin